MDDAINASPGRSPDTTNQASGVALRSTGGLVLLTATVLASSMAFLDATVVNIALPAIGTDLHTTTRSLTWVVTGYTLPLASLILLAGALGDRHGQRKVFAIGVVAFTAGSLGCALASTSETLLLARGIQGLGAAFLTPTSLALLQSSVRPSDHGRAIGLWSGLAGVSAAAGPFLAGGLIELWSWRTIFLINLPVAAVILILIPFLPQTSPAQNTKGRRFDAPGALLLTLGLAAATAGLTNWAHLPFTDPLVVGLLFTGTTSLVLFATWQTTAVNPLIPRTVWSSRAFVSINLVTVMVYAVLSVVFLWLVVTLQVVDGRTPLAAGLALLPVTLLMLAFSSPIGSVSDRIGARAPMAVGLLLSAVALTLLTRIGPTTDYLRDVLIPTTLLGVGLTAMVTPLTSGALSALPPWLAGTASGVNNAAARTGGLLGVAALPVVTGLGQEGFTDARALDSAFDIAMWVCAAFLVAAALLTIRFVPNSAGKRVGPGPVKWHCSVSAPPQPRLEARAGTELR